MIGMRAALVGAGLALSSLFIATAANAVIYTPYNASGSGMEAVTVTAGYSQSLTSTPTNGPDGTGPSNQSIATQETFLTNQFGFTVDDGVQLLGSTGGSSATINVAGDIGYKVFGVHIGRAYLAFAYDTAISSFSIAGLPRGISGIYGFNPGPSGGNSDVPLPGAVYLMGTVLAGGFGAMRLRKRRQARSH